MSEQRRPRWVYGVGDDPDPRFSLSNERTALAWVRTALAMVAGGVALTSLATLADLPRLLDVVAACACLVGGLIAVRAAVGWARVERSLRVGTHLPPPRALGVLALIVVAMALLLAGYAAAQLG
ncbi:YidH family protein [Angustibacter sp. McL0619]|uniref:YidH family protein n=1 Tax=Angustibacter sp. McL0619 TaxID=3415676 RepID=UPI003CF4F95B